MKIPVYKFYNLFVVYKIINMQKHLTANSFITEKKKSAIWCHTWKHEFSAL